MATLHEDLCTFMIISQWILRRTKTFSDKCCSENQNTHFMLNKFLVISAPGSWGKKTDTNAKDIFDHLTNSVLMCNIYLLKLKQVLWKFGISHHEVKPHTETVRFSLEERFSWPRAIEMATSRRIWSASSSAFMRYKMHGRHTALRHSEAGNGWSVQSSGTKICFCSKFSRLARLVSSLLVGRATPLRFTYL